MGGGQDDKARREGEGSMSGWVPLIAYGEREALAERGRRSNAQERADMADVRCCFAKASRRAGQQASEARDTYTPIVLLCIRRDDTNRFHCCFPCGLAWS